MCWFLFWIKIRKKIGGGTPSKLLVAVFSWLNKVMSKRISEEAIFKTTAVIFIWVVWGGKEQKKIKIGFLWYRTINLLYLFYNKTNRTNKIKESCLIIFHWSIQQKIKSKMILVSCKPRNKKHRNHILTTIKQG